MQLLHLQLYCTACRRLRTQWRVHCLIFNALEPLLPQLNIKPLLLVHSDYAPVLCLLYICSNICSAPPAVASAGSCRRRCRWRWWCCCLIHTPIPNVLG